MSSRIGYVCTVSWAGTSFWRVQVLAETKKRFRVRTLSKAKLPRKGWVTAGTEVLVPKDAVTFNKPALKSDRQ